MTIKSRRIINKALTLTPTERISVVDNLLVSLDKPDPEIDALWKNEVERRVRAYKAGSIKAIPVSRVISKYRNNHKAA